MKNTILAMAAAAALFAAVPASAQTLDRGMRDGMSSNAQMMGDRMGMRRDGMRMERRMMRRDMMRREMMRRERMRSRRMMMR